MVISSRDIFKSLFEPKDKPRMPFVPWVCSFAARLEQLRLDEMLADPGLLSSALLNAQQLFGYDAIVTAFDTTLEAECLGCAVDWGEDGFAPVVVSHPIEEGATVQDLQAIEITKTGRLPAIVESTKRIRIVRGGKVAVVGVVTGPLTLARHLGGDSFWAGIEARADHSEKVLAFAAGTVLKVSRLYCEAGVDAILLADDAIAKVDAQTCNSLIAPVKSVTNVARFYGARSILLPGAVTSDTLDAVLSLPVDAIVLPQSMPPTGTTGTRASNPILGLAIPDEALTSPEIASGWATGADGLARSSFISTSWDVPSSASVTAMRALADFFLTHNDSPKPA